MLRWMPILLLACKPIPPSPAPAAPAPPAPVVVPPVEDPDAAVRQTVSAYAGQLRYCYEQRLKAHPTLRGRVEVAWTLHDGTVSASRVLRNDTGDEELGLCIARRLASWRFPRGVSGDQVWPFVFQPR